MYHYCSGDTLLSILRHKTLRFSDVNLLNDAEEGIWGYKIFIEAVNRIIKREKIPTTFPEIPLKWLEDVDKVWSESAFALSSFLACFSRDPDSLSQWRAYADDGRGFAIGFSISQLRRLPIQILDILYDEKRQTKEMIIALGGLFLEMTEREKFNDVPWFRERCILLRATSLGFKNPAWRDEKELRCQHVVVTNLDARRWTLESAGGESAGVTVDPLPIQFRIREGTIVPYFDMPFELSARRRPIKEIVLGPKCPNAPGNVLFLLGNNGFENVDLKFAGGAYR